MPSAPLEIIPAPPDRRVEALSLVLCEIAPSQRRDIAGSLLDESDSRQSATAGLYVALRENRLRGAAWGQRQPGNTAVFWPPQLVAGESDQTAHKLAEAVVRDLDSASICMTQVLLPSPDSTVVPVLTDVGFCHLADLLYLTCEADRFPKEPADARELNFVPYDPSQRGRLMALIERTYDGSQDCPGLNGARNIGEVLDGYQATGAFRPKNWLIIRDNGQDAGVLLLADHPQARHWELMYMGLVPNARGRGWGRHITRHAQWLARRAAVERIVLAVDAANHPALAMYHSTGFEAWDRRTVYVRFLRSFASGT